MSVARFSRFELMPLLDPDGLVEMLALPSRRALYRRIERGTVPPPMRLGSSLRWHPAEVKAWLEAHSTGSCS